MALDFFSHISDALRSRFIEELARRYRVVVITQYLDEDAATSGRYFKSERVSYLKLSPRRRRLLTFCNVYLRHAFVRTFDRLFVTRYYYYRPDHPLRVRFATAAGSLLPKHLAGTAFWTRIERLIIRPSPEFRQLVRAHRPALMITARPGLSPFEAEMVLYAKNLGIPTVATNLNYDNPQSVAKFYRNTDYVLAWNDFMAGQLRDLHGYPAGRVPVTGCMRFDHYFTDSERDDFPAREAFLRSKGLDPARPTIVYVTPTPIMCPRRKEIFEALIRLKTSGKLTGNPNILVRLHPHDVDEPYLGWEKIPGVRVERAGQWRLGDRATRAQKVEMEENDLVNLTATLRYADAVLHFASTMAIEACLFDVPVVSVGFPTPRAAVYLLEYIKMYLDARATRLARDPAELARLINHYLARPELDREGRTKLASVHAQFFDGRSAERAAGAIAQILAVRA